MRQLPTWEIIEMLREILGFAQDGLLTSSILGDKFDDCRISSTGNTILVDLENGQRIKLDVSIINKE